MAGVDNMVHLQVDGGVHDGDDQALLQCETRGVHELQQNGKALGVHLRVQADGVQVAFERVREDGVKQPTLKKGGRKAL